LEYQYRIGDDGRDSRYSIARVCSGYGMVRLYPLVWHEAQSGLFARQGPFISLAASARVWILEGVVSSEAIA
jgi:hypothetical protein